MRSQAAEHSTLDDSACFAPTDHRGARSHEPAEVQEPAVHRPTWAQSP
jgi:hypothetical protein